MAQCIATQYMPTGLNLDSTKVCISICVHHDTWLVF